MAPKPKHGHAISGRQSHEYVCWCMMKARCHRPSATGFADYGGRGITVCERWRKSFADFLADVGPSPTPKHTLERIHNDGHYEPGNVRWATRAEQVQNRRPQPGRKLSRAKVGLIRALLAGGRWKRHQLAARFGVTVHTIADIALGRTWKER